MPLSYVPLLRVQRDLYRLPRSRERFDAYLATMIDSKSGDVRLPLTSMNPMAKDHVPALLDQLLALGADAIGDAVTDDIGEIGADYRVTTVLCDDLLGGWTNRFATEFSSRFETKAMMKRGWIVALLWTSEPAEEGRVRRNVAAAIRRAEFVARHGEPKTLAERMQQEGYALSRAGVDLPPADDRARSVIEPLLETTDMRTSIECLFGDAASRSLGFTERGLPENAGLALALENEKGRVSAA